MNCDTEETRATQKLYNGGVTRYNVDITGEDKDKVIGILNRLDETKDFLEKRIDYKLEPYYYQCEIYCLEKIKKILGGENVKD